MLRSAEGRPADGKVFPEDVTGEILKVDKTRYCEALRWRDIVAGCLVSSRLSCSFSSSGAF